VKRLIAIGLVTTTLTLTTGCANWFGNEPQPTPSPTECPIKEVAAPPDSSSLSINRPREVPPGYSWIVLALEVRALKANDTQADYCIPFMLHVAASQEGNPAPILMASLKSGVRTLPYDAQAITPWFGDRIMFAYDPRSERWRTKPPQYELHLSATYLQDLDLFNVGPLAAFRCVIQANGASIVQDLKTPSKANATTATCNLTAAAYNPY
jgi:hypothetical protein